ncbi:hypothetical protein I4U23_023002 [Adineta vaga]|nr:hypothetical protein I4U23_023002 [Adineta vaga]
MLQIKTYLLFVLSFNFVYKTFAGAGHYWNYDDHGPLTWSQTFPECGGLYQSPINLDYFNVVHKKFPPFLFSSNFNSYLLFNLKNNGHTIVGELPIETSPSIIPQLTGGGLPGIFRFTNFHLHWGASPLEGSEHTINHLHSAGEAHFVFTNEITKQTAVLAFMIVISSDEDSSAWRSYVDSAVRLIREGTQIQFMGNLMELIETENNFQDFWRYSGSLTTPPCTEGIIWTVFNNYIQFSYDEFQALSMNVLHRDFRPIQSEHNRIVYRSTLSNIAVDCSHYMGVN